MQENTKQRILNIAEQLFALQGFATTSLRQITSEAKVNLAAVNYHFGSKDELAEAVLTEHMDRLNKQRKNQLEAIADDLNCAEKLTATLAAFIEPALLASEVKNNHLMQLLIRANAEKPELLHQLLSRRYGRLIKQFAVKLHACLPHLDDDEFRWRFDFVMGAATIVMADNSRTRKALKNKKPYDAHIVAEKLIDFAIAGLTAPSPGE
ncbi:MAG: TetR/AcrR family transcriptional regulator [bacterium]